jgi:type VI secretion system secreted protein VgrG
MSKSIGVPMITGIFDDSSAKKRAPFELRAGPFRHYELEVVSFRGRERVNDVYCYEVTFATEASQATVQKEVFGAPACLMIKSPGYLSQVVQGLVSSLEALGGVAGEQGGDYRRYRLEIVPALWLLKHRRSSRIFQGKTVMEIVETLLEEVGIKSSEYRWRTVDKEYPPLPFMYQRNESDYDFFRRVLATAGIFFYFDHATGWLADLSGGGGGTGATVLNFARRASDTPGVAGPGGTSGADDAPSGTFLFDDGMGADDASERIFQFGLRKRIRSKSLQLLERLIEPSKNWIGAASETAGRAAAGGFGVDAASVKAKVLLQARYQVDPNLTETTQDPKSIDNPQMELELARTRRRFLEARGASDCRRMAAGYRFKVTRHPVTALNGEYTLTTVETDGNNPDFVAKAPFVYRNRFRCIPSTLMPIPRRPKKRPKLGLEVAEVVAYKDILKVPWLESSPNGYVKVRFRWDVVDEHGTPAGELKMGTDDAHAIWVPVLQPWAGAGYGAQFIPREGMEVLVGFLEQQGERPIILGCLYSQANPPPWSDKNAQQKVGIKSQTRAANKGYSEISIDDTQGKEVVTLQAQKDLAENILNNRTTTVGGARSNTVAGSDSLSVGATQTITVAGDRADTVAGKLAFSIGGDLSEAVAGSRAEVVTSDLNSSIQGSRTDSIVGSVTRNVQGDSSDSIGGSLTQHVNGTASVIVGMEEDTTGYSNFYVYGDHSLGAAGNIRISALQSIRLECGGSVLSLTPDALQAAAALLAMAGSTELYLGGKGPSISLTDQAEIAAKTINLLSSGASVSLDSKASVEASSISLGPGAPDASATNNPSLTTQTKSFTLTLTDPTQQPYANKTYKLLVDGAVTSGVTDGNGTLTTSVAPTATLGHLTLWTGEYPEGPRLRWEVQLAPKLEPLDSPRGTLDRLRNLGFFTGAVGDTMTDAGLAALKQFQASQGLPPTGEVDAATAAALSSAHGH